MTEFSLSPFLSLCLSGSLMWLFVHAAYSKLSDRFLFEHQLAGYGVPQRLLPILAWGLALSEALAGVLLMSPWRAFGAMGVGLLLLIYALAMGWQQLNGRRVDCGCSGSQSLPVSWGLVLRNLFLACGSFLLLLPASSGELGRLDAVLAAFAVLLCGVLYAAIHQVLRGRTSWIH